HAVRSINNVLRLRTNGLCHLLHRGLCPSSGTFKLSRIHTQLDQQRAKNCRLRHLSPQLYDPRMADIGFFAWAGLSALLRGSAGGVIAAERGKGFLDGFVISALLGPFGLIWAYRREGSAQRRPCPKCAELILPEATLCPFCRSPIN